MKYHLLFSGHMIDAPGRKPARFEARWEFHVADMIRNYLKAIIKEHPGHKLLAIAGGACGGDIIFHEACIELGIPSVLFLAIPPEDFKKTSVSFAGKSWVKRFDALLQRLQVQVLFPAGVDGDSPEIWERANDWMLSAALSAGGAHMLLLALWDGRKGDASGGTEHMVSMAKKSGAMVKLIKPAPGN